MDIGDRNVSRIDARINPRDKTTIFSIFPKEVIESKITLFPTTYIIPAGNMEAPGRLVIGAASWWKEIYESNQLIQIVEDSENVAKAVINDYNSTLFGSDDDSHPGLFYIPGTNISADEAKTKHSDLFAEALRKQRNYYLKQVHFADQIWSKQQNPAMIGEPMRMAARELGVDKEWASAFVAATMQKCPACGALRDTNFPVCGNCNRVIDTKKYAELGLVLAEK